MKSLTVFLDSSVILSGLASKTGGSRKIINAGKKRKLNLLATTLVIQEVAKHLQKLKIDPSKLKELLSKKTIQVIPNPSSPMIGKFQKTISDPDDAHVLSGAVVSGANTLVSLDKKHILTPTVKKLLKPVQVLSPKGFWDWVEKQNK